MEEFPTYPQYQHHPEWKIIDKALAELEENQDIEITTVRGLVIGFLVMKLAEGKKKAKKSSKKAGSDT